MKKRVKKTSRIRLACSLAQLYARLRDTDRNGYGKCSSCGRQLLWSEGSGCHWHPKGRNYNGACLIAENISLGCSRCNLYLQGNIGPYTQFMLEKYGQDVIDMISAASKKLLTKEEIELNIAGYRNLCKELAKTKNFVVRVP